MKNKAAIPLQSKSNVKLIAALLFIPYPIWGELSKRNSFMSTCCKIPEANRFYDPQRGTELGSRKHHKRHLNVDIKPTSCTLAIILITFSMCHMNLNKPMISMCDKYSSICRHVIKTFFDLPALFFSLTAIYGININLDVTMVAQSKLFSSE